MFLKLKTPNKERLPKGSTINHIKKVATKIGSYNGLKFYYYLLIKL